MKKEYTSEFKAKAVLEVLREEKSIIEIASELNVHRNMLGRWRKEAVTKLHMIFEERKKSSEEKSAYEEQVKELYAQIGELTTKLSWLKKKSGINIQ